MGQILHGSAKTTHASDTVGALGRHILPRAETDQEVEERQCISWRVA